MTKADTIIIKLGDAKALVSKTPKIIRQMVAGGIGGGMAGMAIMPIDTISDTQKQWRNTRNDPELNRVGRSFTATAKELYRPKVRKGSEVEGGAQAFYTGASGKMMKIVPNMALGMMLTNNLEKALKVRI